MEWEYKKINKKYQNEGEMLKELNDLGSLGWEVISLNEFQNKYNVLLKRIKRSSKQIL